LWKQICQHDEPGVSQPVISLKVQLSQLQASPENQRQRSRNNIAMCNVDVVYHDIACLQRRPKHTAALGAEFGHWVGGV
jgi:hypothetical protein